MGILCSKGTGINKKKSLFSRTCLPYDHAPAPLGLSYQTTHPCTQKLCLLFMQQLLSRPSILQGANACLSPWGMRIKEQRISRPLFFSFLFFFAFGFFLPIYPPFHVAFRLYLSSCNFITHQHKSSCNTAQKQLFSLQQWSFSKGIDDPPLQSLVSFSRCWHHTSLQRMLNTSSQRQAMVPPRSSSKARLCTSQVVVGVASTSTRLSASTSRHLGQLLPQISLNSNIISPRKTSRPQALSTRTRLIG